MLPTFFRKLHVENLEKHKYNVTDESLSTSILKSQWLKIQSYIPFCVAPNIITLFGLLSIIFGFYVSYSYYDNYPVITTITCICSTIIYIYLDAIDGIHARKTLNSSPIGEFFDHGCDSIGTILLSMMFCKLFDITDRSLIWKFTMTASLGFLTFHFNSYKTPLKFGKYTGPVEILGYIIASLLLNLIFPSLGKLLVELFVSYSGLMFYSVFAYNVYLSFDKTMNSEFTPMMWLYKSLLTYVLYRNTFIPNISDIFYDATAVSFVTWEFLINRMTKRQSGLFQMLILMFYYISKQFGFVLSIILIILYIRELAYALNLNIFTQNINVYCCGVYDLCHYGHKIMFEKAMAFGTRLIVGVHNNKEVESYKRTPIMTMEERIKEVQTSKHVWKVVPNALLRISQKELDDLNVHIVVCCEDYYNNQDEWYALPRNLGILKPIPYSKEISTTELIKRCKEHVE